ncbi:MAG: hypothetical protein AAJB65_00435 [Candidatus Hodgkinia cicadicola]
MSDFDNMLINRAFMLAVLSASIYKLRLEFILKFAVSLTFELTNIFILVAWIRLNRSDVFEKLSIIKLILGEIKFKNKSV